MKKMIRTICIASMALVLAACGASSSTSAATAEYAVNGGYALSNDAAYDVEQVPQSKTAESSDSSDSQTIAGDKLVYTGSLDIETLNYEDTVKAIREKIKSYNGIIESENESDYNSRWYEESSASNRSLYLTIRIPTEHFQDFLNDMEGTGKVTSRSQNVENISKQYNDNSIEIEALEKQETRLLEMMDQAETVEDMISVETRLSEVQTELNQKKSYQSSMDTDVEYSTINLTLQEVQKYSEEKGTFDISGFGENVKYAFETAGIFFIYVLQHILYGIIYLLPFLVIACVVILIVRHRKKKKAARKAMQQPDAETGQKDKKS